MKYLDSNVFIFPALEPNSKRGISAKRILEMVADGKIEAATSSLTWDEIVWAIKKFSDMEVATMEGRRFLGFPNIKILNADSNILYAAQNLIEYYKIAPRDAIHASSAITKNILEFVSDDSGFDAIKELKRIPLYDVK